MRSVPPTASIADGRSWRTVGDQQKPQPLVDFFDDKPIEEVTTSNLRSYAAHLRARSTRYDSQERRAECGQPGALALRID